MFGTDTKGQFLELRSKGWSLARIGAHLKVSVRTLVDWNRQHQVELQTYRAIELEALQEKILATHEQELTRLTRQLARLEKELDERHLQFTNTEHIFRMAAALRTEIRRLTLKPDFDRDPFPPTTPLPKKP